MASIVAVFSLFSIGMYLLFYPVIKKFDTLIIKESKWCYTDNNGDEYMTGIFSVEETKVRGAMYRVIWFVDGDVKYKNLDWIPTTERNKIEVAMDFPKCDHATKILVWSYTYSPIVQTSGQD